ncbi:hypothetical protein RHGRI_024474 [Rhododendron griersonianum]|uniref:Uncharacterized protein n=1 Tax=Rhododendron griersonianum TaxID=479676 RepID=A0AAV6JBL3_9ERIC|nr:hypothetical protein RHGRI_024474 [Rhododendron griersonianum]
MAKKGRVINALRKDVQMVATTVRLRSSSPSRERYRSISPRPTVGRSVHVKERLGKKVAPYDERMPSLSPDRSQVRGDVRDRLGRPKEDFRYEVPEESSGSFYNLAYTASHETAVDREREGRHDFYLHPPKDMEDLIVRIDQHCQMSEDMAARWKITERSGKTEPGRGGKAMHNIPKEKGKDRWGEQGGGGYQKDNVRRPKPHEFEASPIVFKDPLHELLKKIEHEPFFTLPTDNIPCPKVKDNKYRCTYHARRDHLRTWSVGGWKRVRDEVVGAESGGLKEIGRYGDMPNVSIREGREIWS